MTLPALLPGVVSAASVVFLFCSTAFGVVLTMGGLRYANVETEIYLLTTQELDLSGAAALSVLQLLVIVALLALSARTRRAPAPARRPVAGPTAATRDAALLAVDRRRGACFLVTRSPRCCCLAARRRRLGARRTTARSRARARTTRSWCR